MDDRGWSANATLALPFHPDAPVPVATTLRHAVESWTAMTSEQRGMALLFFQDRPPEGEPTVLGAPRLAQLAAQLTV